ncbi:DUF72 domain-containing protein [Mucilaginibacter conchicola]|uniref:DUF72 domain-containing protein n=1 Tax=Mucilaginibacter conchicola TaxID=2303333 RepID=A0A372NSK6_9SPHI|nr:DUF72 domain-containing protein [Mucilaginibacter conchicola]RFZ91253.1 DUF72 domain-containing protein [Mucilaginibacter conchicola]
MDKMTSAYYSGTSNLVLPVSSKRLFPEAFRESSRLTYYASLFNSVEINSSFYRIPLARTVRRWSEEVPEDFVFTFKLHRSVTHSLPGRFDMGSLDAFMQAAGSTSKRACLLVQLPPKFGPDLRGLSALLAALKPYDWRVSVEFRHRGWYQPEVYGLLREYGAGMVLHDMPGASPPLTETAGHVFLRFHGPEKGYRGSYSDAYLAEYAGYIREWQLRGLSVFAYFNNTLGAAVQNLQTLNRLAAAPGETKS